MPKYSPQSYEPAVEYREIYGLQVFDCLLLKATLQPTSCAAQWRHNRDGSVCRTCSLGALHAGADQNLDLMSRSTSCVRCNGGDRLLSGTLCVGCYNRAREVLYGQNRKGNFPRLWSQRLLHTVAIIAILNPDIALALHRRKRLHRVGAITLPQWSEFDSSHLWLEWLSTGQEEVYIMVARLMPGSRIVAIDRG